MQEMSSRTCDPGVARPAVALVDAAPAAPAESPREDMLLRHHRQMLAIACGIIVLSLALTVRDDDHAAFRLLPKWPIPSTCPSQVIFGVDCPGCGLTRSFIYLAHGDWSRALLKNRVGWLVALAVVLQIPYRLACILGRNRKPLGERLPGLFGAGLVVALIGNWLLRVFGV
jgi:hypothetical protein